MGAICSTASSSNNSSSDTRRSGGDNSRLHHGVEQIDQLSTGGEEAAAVLLGVAAVVAVGLVIWGLSSTGSSKKTMKAPGRDGYIYRDDFERDPSAYFRDLRKY